MRTHKWNVKTDDGEVRVEYSRGWNDSYKPYVLLVNGKRHRMQSRAAFYVDIDYEFQIGNHTFNFVAAGVKCDLACDGVFLTSKLKYRKSRRLPLPSWLVIISEIIVLLLEWILPLALARKVVLWAVPCTFLTFLTVMMTHMLGKATFARPKDYLPIPLIVTFIKVSILIAMLVFYC